MDTSTPVKNGDSLISIYITGIGFHAGKNCLQVAHPTHKVLEVFVVFVAADSCWRSVIASTCITCGERNNSAPNLACACSKF